MRDKSELTDLFRNRLSQTEMEVRDGFWESLEDELATPVSSDGGKTYRLTSRVRRWLAAASVLLLAGAVTALLWKPASQSGGESLEKIPLASAEEPQLSHVETETEEAPASLRQEPKAVAGRGGQRLLLAQNGRQQVEAPDDESVSVHVAITITQRQYRHRPGSAARRRMDAHMFRAGDGYVGNGRDTSRPATEKDNIQVEECDALLKTPRWAWKASLGTSLPKGGFHAPLTAGVSVERRLNKRLSLEAGLQYHRLAEAGGETLHALGIPVRLNILLAGNSKVDFYALAGGEVEKCVAGAPDNGFGAEPVQGSLMAGLGVRYKMNDRLALFAEPTVSHHFDNDSSTQSLRTERPTNLNLLCGLRMAF